MELCDTVKRCLSALAAILQQKLAFVLTGGLATLLTCLTDRAVSTAFISC